MVRYVFREDEPIRIKGAKDADPQRIGEALEAISKAEAGELTPKAVVEAARSPNHALHANFEWNDAIAAEAHRLDQARHIIRIVRVEDAAATNGSNRAFLSISDKAGTSYRPLADVRASVGMQDAILKAAARDLDAFQRRYKDLIDVCEAVSKAKEAIQRRQDRQERRAA